MTASGRDEDLIGQHGIAVLGFLDVDLATPVQPLGKDRRELRRHVLNNQNRRQGRREERQYLT